MFVTDTHSFIWFLTKDKRLPPKIKEIFRSCDRGEEIIIVPSIVLLECLYICERKNVNIKFRDVLRKLHTSYNYPIYPLDEEVVIECSKITKLTDLHDRIIVATAKLLNVSLITKDKEIKDSKLVKTVW